jgi:pyrimidine-specific ribonucleoside hydrolase
VTIPPLPVLLDVDTGLDDACALLLAALHPHLDLRAVTCVFGNADVDQVVRNTVRVLAAAGRLDVPVGRGAVRAPAAGASGPRRSHGVDGLGDLDHVALGLPAASADPHARPAVELLHDVLAAAQRVGERPALVALGPLTNVAQLLKQYPDVSQALGRIVCVGGLPRQENRSATADFNVRSDPEAADAVTDLARQLAVPLTSYGMNVFFEVSVSRAETAALLASPSAAARLAGALVGAQCDRFDAPAATIGDAGAVCAVIDPDGLDVLRDNGIDVVRSVDAGRWRRLWLDTVSGRK